MKTRPSVFVTRPVPGSALDRLRKEADVEVREEDTIISKNELLEGVKGKDALLCILTDPVDQDVIVAGNQLKIISNFGAGFDKIDVAAATRRGIPVTNTPGALTETTADMTMGLIIAAARRIVEGDKYTRECKYDGWGPSFFLGNEVHGKTLGVIGMGKIGTALSRRAIHGFHMNVLYDDYGGEREKAKEWGARCVSMETLLKESDFISLHVPLTPKTNKLIDERALKHMKPTAVLVNTSRGDVIDQHALARALKNKEIGAAALDVYEDEPRCPVELIPLSNVILIPHTGSATKEARSAMSDMAVDALIDFFNGRTLQNLVNPDALKKG
ncbi:D-glycerate dehydrogenase [Candidatus Micrarchaeota archaeon]|nr:D-glycerate dehydrogenase [Candidatus Micrarchaeota archaeon]